MEPTSPPGPPSLPRPPPSFGPPPAGPPSPPGPPPGQVPPGGPGASPYGPPPYPPPYPGQVTPPKKSNGKVIAIVAGLAACLLLLCCGAVVAGVILVQRGELLGTSEQTSAPTASATIDWVTWRSTPELDQVWSDLADQFSEETGHDVQVQAVEQERLAVMFEFEPPALFYTSGGYRLRDQVRHGRVRDITDDLADVIATIPSGLLAPYTVDGRIYGLPYHVGGVGFWYNKALFAEAGLDPERPPQTWDEFLDAVDTLKRAGVTPVALGGADDWTATYWFGALATRTAGAGAFTLAVEERSLMDNPGITQAAELLEQFVAREPFQPNYEDAPYFGPGGQASLVASGEAAMELLGTWAPSMHDVEVPGGLGEDLGWFPFPTVDGGKGNNDIYVETAGFAVAADAPDATLDLLRSLYRGENYERIVSADRSLIPVIAGFEPAESYLTPVLRAVHEASLAQANLDTEVPPSTTFELHDSVKLLLAGHMDADQTLERITVSWQAASD